MSRVRDALKRANAMTPSAETEAISEVFGGGAEPEEVSEGFASPDSSSLQPSTANEAPGKLVGWLMRYRFAKKILKRVGVRTGAGVQKCQGTTRSGQPCRGPAMANGYCRLHGGSRNGIVAEKTRELIGRVMPAR